MNNCNFFHFRILLALLIGAGSQVGGGPELAAATARYRATWRTDPATSIVIGFDHYSGFDAKLVYDLVDHGTDAGKYRFSAVPAKTFVSHGMRNTFVRLTQLRPGTQYYFLIVDSEGTSQRMAFETAPRDPVTPLSIIAGGDSRNNREVARAANQLVSKLRPHFVLFGGDMTTYDSAEEWKNWFDDWQLTISADGRLTPIVPARGNHEKRNSTIFNLFDIPHPNAYYSLDFGNGLLTVYTLNTEHPPGGDQQQWLQSALAGSTARWKIAQYHQAMRPHTAFKKERDDLIFYWATLFQSFGVNLVVESDGHVVKQTYPIRPSKGPGSSQHFIRDDQNGTVYSGEGGWGAPLRDNDDDKPWTRASDRFNQFKWIWVRPGDLQVRTVVLDRSTNVQREVSPAARFVTPPGVYYWDADNGGDVLIIPPRQPEASETNGVAGQAGTVSPPSIGPTGGGRPTLSPDGQRQVTVPFALNAGGAPTILVVAGEGRQLRVLQRFDFPVRGPGPYKESITLPPLPQGEPAKVVVKVGSGVLVEYLVR